MADETRLQQPVRAAAEQRLCGLQILAEVSGFIVFVAAIAGLWIVTP